MSFNKAIKEVNLFPGIGSGLYSAEYIRKWGRNKTIASTAQEVIEDASFTLANTALSTTADINRFSSSNDTDTQTIEVQGLDADWNLVTQEVILGGQLKKTLPTNLIRVFRVRNLSSVALAGDVYIYVQGGGETLGKPDTDSYVRAKVLAGNNQTGMAKFTIPAGYTGYLTSFYASLLKGSGVTAVAADIELYVREYGGLFRSMFQFGLQTTGKGTHEKKFDFPELLPAKTDIEVRATPSAVADIAAGFEIALIPA